MTFQEAIKIVRDALHRTGMEIFPEDYDGIIVKKLEASNTLDEGRTTNQTHIAITGNQMDIFPYLKSDGYFVNNDNALKKYFVTKAPVILFESNCAYLSMNTEDYQFSNGRLESSVSIVRSKRTNAADQIQLSLINMDGTEFYAFRKALHVGACILFLKEKAQFRYHVFGIKPESVSSELLQLNNKFYMLATQTGVESDTCFSKPEQITVEAHRDKTIEELAAILHTMYNNSRESGRVAAIHMFGLKYGDIVLSNGYSQKAIINLAGINESFISELNKGINIYRSVKNNEYGVSFASDAEFQDSIMNHSVYGIHIAGKNTALSSDNPHICIGWSKMGNLSDCTTKEDIEERYAAIWPDVKPKTKGQNVGQIYRFVLEAKAGDYVVYGDGAVAHIGVIQSDYYYQEVCDDQDLDYVNNRKVDWKKDIPYADLSAKFKSSLGSAMSFFRLNDYKSVILELLNGGYQVDDDYDDTEIEIIPENRIIERTPRIYKEHPLNLIIYGAPGTGKTYSTTEQAVARIENRSVREGITQEERVELQNKYRALSQNGQIVFTTFHQNYSYEDFIQGLRPDSKNGVLDFVPVDGVFKKLANRAMCDQNNNYVIIIDEINRGNISKVFGELITLIEDDKRWGETNQLSVILPSGEEFAVPNNLYIIGTMNSADKSIALIDTALRRRFDFKEVSPNLDLITDDTLKKVLKALNASLRKQLDSSDLLIGHAYFIGKTAEDLPYIINRNIIPLLYEYFYDQEKKVKDTLVKALEGTSIAPVDNDQGRIWVR